LDTGIQGVTPGPDTEEYLAKRERELRTLGGLSMAALAAVTQLFDAWCQRTLGVAIGTLSLLLLVGLVTSAVRQVPLWSCSPVSDHQDRMCGQGRASVCKALRRSESRACGGLTQP